MKLKGQPLAVRKIFMILTYDKGLEYKKNSSNWITRGEKIKINKHTKDLNRYLIKEDIQMTIST